VILLFWGEVVGAGAGAGSTCFELLGSCEGIKRCSVVHILVVCAHGTYGLNGVQALSYGG
jgi:hypothetical protein